MGEGAIGLAVAGVRPLIERLFAGWSAERGQILIETLHDVVLGDGVEEVVRLAAAAERAIAAEAFLPSEQGFYCGSCPHASACRDWHRRSAATHVRMAA